MQMPVRWIGVEVDERGNVRGLVVVVVVVGLKKATAWSAMLVFIVVGARKAREILATI